MKTKIKQDYLANRLSEQGLQEIIDLKSQAGEAFLRLDADINSGAVSEAVEDVKSHHDYQLAITIYLQALYIMPTISDLEPGSRAFNCSIDIISHLADLYSWAGENTLSIHYYQMQLRYPELLLDLAGAQTDVNIRFNLGVNFSELAGSDANALEDAHRVSAYPIALDHLRYAILEYRRLTQHYESYAVKAVGAREVKFAHSIKDHYINEAKSAADDFDKALMGYAFVCTRHGRHSTPMAEWEEGSRQQVQWQNILAYQASDEQLQACYSDRSNLAVGGMALRVKVLEGAGDFHRTTPALFMKAYRRKSSEPVDTRTSNEADQPLAQRDSYMNLQAKFAPEVARVEVSQPLKKRSKVIASQAKPKHLKVKINLARFRKDTGSRPGENGSAHILKRSFVPTERQNTEQATQGDFKRQSLYSRQESSLKHN